MDKKRCWDCNKLRKLKFFSRNKSKNDGLATECKDCVNKYNRKLYSNTKKSLVYYHANRQNILKKKRLYYKNNKNKENERQKLYRKKNINARLAFNLRIRINNALKFNYKRGSAIRDLGCSVEYLKTYLEKKFKKGMTWANYGYGVEKWHIDHIIPLSKFKLTQRSEFLKACHYSNLQPLWQHENLSKGNKLWK